MKSLSKIYRAVEEHRIHKLQFRDLEEMHNSGDNGMFIFGRNRDDQAGKTPFDVDDRQEASFSDGKDASLEKITAEEAESLRKQVFSEGWQEGFMQGKQAGREESEEQFQKTTQALVDAMEKINGMRGSLMNSNKQDMVRLVMAVAQQVIQAEVSISPEVVLRAVESAIRSAVQSEEYRISVNPGDLDLVKESKPLFLASVSGLKDIVFESDESIAPGGSIVKSDQGIVDASIETQLENLQKRIFNVIHEEEANWNN